MSKRLETLEKEISNLDGINKYRLKTGDRLQYAKQELNKRLANRD